MTEDQIATMQADILAGTPGDWLVSVKNPAIVLRRDGAYLAKLSQTSANEYCHESDARRIARVPLMERTITAQAAEIKLLLAALLECQAELDAYYRQECFSYYPEHERYRREDFDWNPARIAIAQLKEVHKE
jgi:hypothetical protein